MTGDGEAVVKILIKVTTSDAVETAHAYDLPIDEEARKEFISEQAELTSRAFRPVNPFPLILQNPYVVYSPSYVVRLAWEVQASGSDVEEPITEELHRQIGFLH